MAYNFTMDPSIQAMPEPEPRRGVRGWLANPDNMEYLGSMGQGLLAASGWSDRPITLGEGLAQGMALGNATRDKQADRKRQKAYDDLQNRIQKRKEEEMLAAAAEAKAQRDEQMRKRESAVLGVQKLYGVGAEEAGFLADNPYLAQMLKKEAAPGLLEVSPGATLYDPSTGKSVFTAPKQFAPTGEGKPSDPLSALRKDFEKQWNASSGQMRSDVKGDKKNIIRQGSMPAPTFHPAVQRGIVDSYMGNPNAKADAWGLFVQSQMGGEAPTPAPSAQKQVVRTGKDKSGRVVVQYSDGTVSYK